MDGLLNLSLLAQEAMPVLPDSTEWLSGIDPDHKFGLLLAIILTVTLVVIVLGCVSWGFLNLMHRRRLEADLKRDMLDRGMSAEEVAKVIEATAPQGVAERWVASKNK